MVPAPPPLPTRFPCYCRAVYSWGGEVRRKHGGRGLLDDTTDNMGSQNATWDSSKAT